MAIFRKGTHGWKLESRRESVRKMRHALYGMQRDKSVDLTESLDVAINALYRIDSRLLQLMNEQSNLCPSDLQE